MIRLEKKKYKRREMESDLFRSSESKSKRERDWRERKYEYAERRGPGIYRKFRGQSSRTGGARQPTGSFTGQKAQKKYLVELLEWTLVKMVFTKAAIDLLNDDSALGAF